MSVIDSKLLTAIQEVSGDETNKFKDKWISILGDSYSTFPGYISDGLIANEHDGFTDVKQMWWHQLLTKLNAKLCVNCSCSGMKATGETATTSALFNQYYSKLHRETGKTYINLDGSKSTATEDIKPDIILIMLGINDWNGNAALGSPGYSIDHLTTYDTTQTTDFMKAIEQLMLLTSINYLGAQIYVICQPQCKFGKTGSTNYPVLNDATSPWTMSKAGYYLAQSSTIFGAKFINLNRLGVLSSSSFCGSNRFWLSDTTHPSVNGNKVIAAYVYQEMKNDSVCWNMDHE